MSWKNMKVMDLKIQLISDWQTKDFNVTELSQKYGISRPIVYKWIRRYEAHGIEGLQNQSRAPLQRPNKTPESIINLILQEKVNNIKRGPKKIYAKLKEKYHNV